MTYTVHKEGRPFRTCADLNEARECINENGGDGGKAAFWAAINRKRQHYADREEKHSDPDGKWAASECGLAISYLVQDLVSAGAIQEQKDGEQWTIK